MNYFDNAATTRPSDEVTKAMLPYMTTEYGNPSSQYALGNAARDAVEDARCIIARSINAEPSEIFFTSGGSESNSWVIKEFHRESGFYVRNIVTSRIEHHSLLNACEQTSRMFCGQTSYVKNERDGFINIEHLEKLARNKPTIVSIMAVNNEIGTIEPLSEIGALCSDLGVPFHTDAVQAYGHIPIDVKEMHIDMLSASGHKINGPKGIGFLYVNQKWQKNLSPLICGGQQEQGLRGGTENVPAIVGLGVAAQMAMKEMNVVNARCASFRRQLADEVIRLGEIINSPENGSARHLNFRFDGIRAEVWNEFLNEYGFCISSGSACNSKSNKPSHVLMAIGLTEKQANESIRVSFGRDNTQNEVTALINALKIGSSLLKE